MDFGFVKAENIPAFKGRVTGSRLPNYPVSGVNWGSEGSKTRRDKDLKKNLAPYQRNPTYSSYAPLLSSGSKFLRPSLISRGSWQKLVKAAGFTKVTPAGLAVLTNTVDHQMDIIIEALRHTQENGPNPGLKVFGATAEQMDHFLATIQKNGVPNAGQEYNLDLVHKSFYSNPRPTRQMSKETEELLSVYHILPPICKLASSVAKKLRRAINGLTYADSYSGITVQSLSVKKDVELVARALFQRPNLMEEFNVLPKKSIAFMRRSFADAGSQAKFLVNLTQLAIAVVSSANVQELQSGINEGYLDNDFVSLIFKSGVYYMSGGASLWILNPAKLQQLVTFFGGIMSRKDKLFFRYMLTLRGSVLSENLNNLLYVPVKKNKNGEDVSTATDAKYRLVLTQTIGTEGSLRTFSGMEE